LSPSHARFKRLTPPNGPPPYYSLPLYTGLSYWAFSVSSLREGLGTSHEIVKEEEKKSFGWYWGCLGNHHQKDITMTQIIECLYVDGGGGKEEACIFRPERKRISDSAISPSDK